MSRRTERVGRLIQQTIGEIVLRRISDPRIDPARVSITRVEVTEDMTRAKVYCSTMGTEAEQRNALRALQHAAGRIQGMMMREISLRNTPVLQFVPDERFKKTLTTLALIQSAMEEIRQDEEAHRRSDAGDGGTEPGEPR
ncbi:MAG: 30S ribosome-binding factor RbfA [Planctomycetota bacterium]